MKFEIKNRWSGEVQYSCELSAEMADKSYSVQLGFAVKKAVADNASLDGASLDNASLVGARLDNASLVGASLDGARLVGASLVGARLDNASLVGASLDGASLDNASLDGARLDNASLVGARLRPIRADFYDVLSWAPREVPALIDALKEGRVDGSTYTGECACLVGTIANVRGVDYVSLEHDGGRPIECFFSGIREGDTPETNQFSAIALEWAESWLANMKAAFVPKTTV